VLAGSSEQPISFGLSPLSTIPAPTRGSGALVYLQRLARANVTWMLSQPDISDLGSPMSVSGRTSDAFPDSRWRRLSDMGASQWPTRTRFQTAGMAGLR
jgi:hypothetical protein